MTLAKILDLKTHLKILGVIYMGLGGFIVAFVLLVLWMGVMSYFGKSEGITEQSFSDAMIVFFVLIYPAIWILQTGYGLYKAQRSARMWGIILAAILLIGLNVLLLFDSASNGEGRGFQIFHYLMILIGVYTLIVLIPKKVTESLT